VLPNIISHSRSSESFIQGSAAATSASRTDTAQGSCRALFLACASRAAGKKTLACFGADSAPCAGTRPGAHVAASRTAAAADARRAPRKQKHDMIVSLVAAGCVRAGPTAHLPVLSRRGLPPDALNVIHEPGASSQLERASRRDLSPCPGGPPDAGLRSVSRSSWNLGGRAVRAKRLLSFCLAVAGSSTPGGNAVPIGCACAVLHRPSRQRPCRRRVADRHAACDYALSALASAQRPASCSSILTASSATRSPVPGSA